MIRIMNRSWSFQLNKILAICYFLSELLNIIGITRISEYAIHFLCSLIFTIELARYAELMAILGRNTVIQNIKFIIMVFSPLCLIILHTNLQPYMNDKLIYIGHKMINVIIILEMFHISRKYVNCIKKLEVQENDS